MQRFTITIDDALMEAVDALMARRGYASRSEAVREMLREAAARETALAEETPCVATLGYVYDHETRALAQRLSRAAHENHDLTVASLHVHLDHETCLEVSILRGPSGAVRGLANDMTAQRGVRHAHLQVIPVSVEETTHRHGDREETHRHVRA